MLVITIALILLIVIFIAVIAVAVAVYLSSSRSKEPISGTLDQTYDIKKAETIRETERPTPEPEHELESFASSDTVKEDYSPGVIEDLHASFSSQATVDSMGDASVRADDSDEDVDLKD